MSMRHWSVPIGVPGSAAKAALALSGIGRKVRLRLCAAAIASFERAVSIEDQLVYSEPEPLPFGARHWLGAALLEADRFADAERVYREELKDHPHNGWSLFGLKAALSGQGRSSSEVNADFDASWARADTWIRASRF